MDHRGIFSPNHTPPVIERLYDCELFSDICEEKFIRQDRLEELPDFPHCAGAGLDIERGVARRNRYDRISVHGCTVGTADR